MDLNRDYEKDRLAFICQRDGLEAAKKFAKQLIKVYTASTKAFKQKHCKNHPYRRVYIESAVSARHLLRTHFLESLRNE